MINKKPYTVECCYVALLLAFLRKHVYFLVMATIWFSEVDCRMKIVSFLKRKYNIIEKRIFATFFL